MLGLHSIVPLLKGGIQVSDAIRDVDLHLGFQLIQRDLGLSFGRQRFRCPPFAQIFALGAAIDFIAGIGIDAIAERILALNMYLTFRLGRAGFEVLSPGGEHRSGETQCVVAEPTRAQAFLKEQGVSVTEKPQGVRIATHFFNDERDVDRCVEALVAFTKTL